MKAIASALTEEKSIRELISKKKVAVFLDYDGTLTPIVARPELAILSEEMRDTLKFLASLCTIGIISGRSREDVESLVQIPEIFYAGSHGFDIKGPNLAMTPSEVPPLLPAIQEAYQDLLLKTQDIAGCLLENKRYALAIHYRQVNPSRVPEIEAMVEKLAKADSRLRKTTGKMVFELRVNYPWDKGKALLYFLKALHEEGEDILPFYLGDDDTDEDAFKVLSQRGVGILVSEVPQESFANYSLNNVGEVKLFLDKLTAWIKFGAS